MCHQVFFGLVGHDLLGYHFPTFRRKLRSAFSKIIDCLTDTENWAVGHPYLSCNNGAFPAQSVTSKLFVAVYIMKFGYVLAQSVTLCRNFI